MKKTVSDPCRPSERTRLEVFKLPEGILAERDVPVAMRDGCVLSVNIFRPLDSGTYPVIMSFTPYGKDVGPKGWLIAAGEKCTFEELPLYGSEPGTVRVSDVTSFEAPDPAYWVPHGYAVVIADVRGYFKSKGFPGIFTIKDARDCADLIEWAAGKPWSNGNVGLNGVSYLAISQWFAASQRPPHLKAIIPWQGVSDLYRDVLFHGGIPETKFTRDWMRVMRVGARFPNPILSPIVSWFGQKLFFHLVKAFTLDTNLENIDVPALVCGTWSDQGLHTRGSFEGYTRISSRFKWLYTHGRKKWEVFYSEEGLRIQKQFFDYFLKNIPNGMIDVPKVRIEVRETIEKSQVRFEKEWPLSKNRYTKMYLAPRSSLSLNITADANSVSYDTQSGHGVHFDYVFAEDTELTGYMKLRLWVSTGSGRDMDLFAGIRKFDHDGREVYFEGGVAGFEKDMVAAGWLRVSQRELDPKRSRTEMPYLGHRRRRLIKPGEIVPVDIEILPSSTLFRQGESLRLVIQGSDITDNPSIRHTMLVNKGMHTIHFGDRHDSHLLIPVVI